MKPASFVPALPALPPPYRHPPPTTSERVSPGLETPPLGELANAGDGYVRLAARGSRELMKPRSPLAGSAKQLIPFIPPQRTSEIIIPEAASTACEDSLSELFTPSACCARLRRPGALHMTDAASLRPGSLLRIRSLSGAAHGLRGVILPRRA